MCRSIQVLRGVEPPAATAIEAAALQFVRKVSGMRHPAERNRPAFDTAVAEVTRTVEKLLAALPPSRSRSATTTVIRDRRRPAVP